ncbi:uncharacterized protein LOC111409676 [Olea europaea var. sylvestris]|uniref:Transcriptional coactivator Hfi1 Transcriptional adapter 1 n=1 Tax=Olea europaea subsp. europaea TaxID=158383 RepID=A0A8S0PVC8_OLEEU|nr:uncharacterized protein LOC111409676 [Olea europaea var. sylvestris]CAA2958490.1 Transcriptional coactivator Hfi1 Transcriptional adapter 1 [Olea europaea subsp. europaea]
MVAMNSALEMPVDRHCFRIDTSKLKLQIERRVGRLKSEKYFNLLNSFLSLRLSKREFDKLCIELLGRDNISLHNGLIRAILKNASVAKTPPKRSKVQPPPNVKVPNGYQRNSLQSICRDTFPQSPRKGRTLTPRDRKFKDSPSPLGPLGKVQEQQSATELLSLGSRPPVEVTSVEDGEEVEQCAGSPGIYSRSPLRAPLGISLNAGGTRKVLLNEPPPYENCCTTRDLPDTSSLRKRLEQKFKTEGLNVSTDCAGLLNNGLDVFLKRLIKPCLDLSASRSEHQLQDKVHHQDISVRNKMGSTYIKKPPRSFSVSMPDFQVAMESNPRILGEDWPVKLENVSFRASDYYMAE